MTSSSAAETRLGPGTASSAVLNPGFGRTVTEDWAESCSENTSLLWGNIPAALSPAWKFFWVANNVPWRKHVLTHEDFYVF